MAEDPRRAIVEVIGRLGRETQFHLDERYRHFRITDAIILAISLLLIILAGFNVYYVRVLYKDLDGIVGNMESMYQNLVNIDTDMTTVTKYMEAFDGHIRHMDAINGHMTSLAGSLPKIRAQMDGITGDMDKIRQNMQLVAQGMGVIDERVHAMSGGVSAIRDNVGQFARPVSGMMPFMR